MKIMIIFSVLLISVTSVLGDLELGLEVADLGSKLLEAGQAVGSKLKSVGQEALADTRKANVQLVVGEGDDAKKRQATLAISTNGEAANNGKGIIILNEGPITKRQDIIGLNGDAANKRQNIITLNGGTANKRQDIITLNGEAVNKRQTALDDGAAKEAPPQDTQKLQIVSPGEGNLRQSADLLIGEGNKRQKIELVDKVPIKRQNIELVVKDPIKRQDSIILNAEENQRQDAGVLDAAAENSRVGIELQQENSAVRQTSLPKASGSIGLGGISVSLNKK